MERLSSKLMNWASILEDDTRAQALETASMPFVHPHVALMPDAHLGRGATVGSVIPTERSIIPAAVGVDIGCGMIALRTDVRHAAMVGRDPGRLRSAIEQAVPLSPGRYNADLTTTAQVRVAELSERDGFETADRLAPNWPLQLGSLGGGNHFIEVCTDEEGWLWLFLHSGSRGVGNKIAQHHIKVAQQECERWWIDLPNRDLAYLVEGTGEFTAYIRDLRWAQHFALLNRAEMMDRVAACFEEWSGHSVAPTETINCHHNYTVRERHFGRDVWLSRKGAIDAAPGVAGLIPGSMGAASYVVVGKGDAMSLNSSPHGAGRNYSRAKARKTFTHEDLRARMHGIAWRDSAAFLDEHPGAYKDIDVVMRDAADLVEVTHTLRQIVNVKGQ